MNFLLADIPVPLVYATYRIIRDCNDSFAHLFGYTARELVNQSFSRLYPELADFVRTGELWRAHLTDGKIYHDERVMADAAGNRFWCRVNGTTRNPVDPFAEAIYCFQKMNRPVTPSRNVLSGRQQQILSMIALGKTNMEIARELLLSQRTVESHRLRMMKLTSTRNTAELVAWFSTSPEAETQDPISNPVFLPD